VELRFTWNGELAHSQVYRDIEELLRVSISKREELLARGGWEVAQVASGDGREGN
jgi:hypothetical protein